MARLIEAPAGACDDHIEFRGTLAPRPDVVRTGAAPHNTLGREGAALGLSRSAGLLALLCVGVAAAGAAPARAEVVGRPSVGLGGAEANGASYSADLSGTGRFVAFASEATNLVRGDTNGFRDVFVRDRERQVTARVSVGPRWAQANEGSSSASISRDGRFVAFTSQATNLVAGRTLTGSHAYVRDRRAGTTRLVSVASDGTPANYPYSLARDISADGRFVLFYSEATNLVPGGDANGDTGDMFVHELATGRTEPVSVSSGGVQGSSFSFKGAISADGRFVVFSSEAGNLVPGDTNVREDVFVRDRRAGTTERVSVGPRGRQANGPSADSALSADARFVVFGSGATNLVAGDTNGRVDVFLRDREAKRTTRVSVGAGGAQGNDHSVDGRVSADGRRVVFSSLATNLVPGDTNDAREVFVHDRGAGRTRRVSVGPGGAQADGESLGPAISADGGLASFNSGASNLWPGDTNGAADVFVARTR